MSIKFDTNMSDFSDSHGEQKTHAHPAHPSELPLRRRRDRRQLAAGVGGLYLAGSAQGRGLQRRCSFHRCDDQRPLGRRAVPRRDPQRTCARRGGCQRQSPRRSTRQSAFSRSPARMSIPACGSPCWAGSTRPSCTSRCCPRRPWVDVIVRGEGEEILVELIRCRSPTGRWRQDAQADQGPRLPGWR